MRAENVGRTVAAATEILQTVLREKPALGNAQARREVETSYDISVVSQIRGDVAGYVVWSMSVITADRIASRMSGQTVVTFDKVAAKSISELGMLINAQVITNLQASGCEATISPATIVRGPLSRTDIPKKPSLVFPIELEDIGRLELSLSLFAQERVVA